MKILKLTVVTLMMMFVLAGCSGESKSVEVDMPKLAGDLEATVTSGSLKQVASDLVSSTYFIDMEKVDDSIAYMNAATSACEVVVIKCKEADYVAEAEKLLKQRVTNQNDLYKTYNTEEAAKLDKALVKSAGNYVVLCVTDDAAKAESVLKEAGF